jgi:hypothetical protein
MVIVLPEFSDVFQYENNFHLSCDITRISKILAHYELYKKVADLPGALVECGVFKGVSLTLFVEFREIVERSTARKIIGFDTFEQFPETFFAEDREFRRKFISVAGIESISKDQLIEVLKRKNLYTNIELIEGDITETLPLYVRDHPELRIALLNLDTDIYEPAVTILECLYPRIVSGGILLLDNYGVTTGETKAIDDYFTGKDIKIQKLPFRETPAFIMKE